MVSLAVGPVLSPSIMGSTSAPTGTSQASAASFTSAGAPDGHRERVLLDHARNVLEQRHAAAALQELAQHAQQFPESVFAAERDELRRIALEQIAVSP
jgi:hypothetical protein